jgi:methylated-DNA-[protein]-cysteine S-methyltransferase
MSLNEHPFSEEQSLELDSPVGTLVLTASDGALTRLERKARGRAGRTAGATSHGRHGEASRGASPAERVLLAAQRQLEEYFSGKRTQFDLPLAPSGTAFQQQVWRALLEIPYGKTWSYQRLARAIGRPTAMRAVGACNGRNPIAIIIPCHRVIGADGSLTGYGGGLPMKRWLLAHEAARAQPALLPLPRIS